METPDFRALCARFCDAVDLLCGSGESPARPGERLILTTHIDGLEELAAEARAALEAVPVTPDPADVLATYYAAERSEGGTTDEVITRGLMAVLARYSTPAPVAVAERLPEEGDCAPWPDDPDTQHWCWAGVVVDDGWEWHQRSPGVFTFFRDAYTHWLPWWALPLPEAQP